jgi:predicted HicB family RNase H-like nuclease
MIYKGYEGEMEWDHSANRYFGRVINTNKDVITFVGNTTEEAKQSFRDSVDDYLEMCKQSGSLPEKPQ